MLKRLSIGYRHAGEGPGGGVPLPEEAFWDDLKVTWGREFCLLDAASWVFRTPSR